jgi:hypothetical protein
MCPSGQNKGAVIGPLLKIVSREYSASCERRLATLKLDAKRTGDGKEERESSL